MPRSEAVQCEEQEAHEMPKRRGSLTAFCSALLDIRADRVLRTLLTSKSTTTVHTTADDMPQAEGSAQWKDSSSSEPKETQEGEGFGQESLCVPRCPPDRKTCGHYTSTLLPFQAPELRLWNLGLEPRGKCSWDAVPCP